MGVGDKAANYHRLLEDIQTSAKRAGRSTSEIRLIAVIKNISWHEAAWLYDLGQRNFGENRVIEAVAKRESAPVDCRWHLIGHLQSNKIKKAIGKFALIHSVDTPELAEKIAHISQQAKTVTPVLLQVNTSGESSKQGLSEQGWLKVFEQIVGLEGIQLKGLMTMAPLNGTESEIRQCFQRVRNFKEKLSKTFGLSQEFFQLSMGMSQDYRLAIEEGATLLRIGTALTQPVIQK